MIRGYPNPASVLQGEVLRLHIASDTPLHFQIWGPHAKDFVQVVKVGNKTLRGSGEMVTAQEMTLLWERLRELERRVKQLKEQHEPDTRPDTRENSSIKSMGAVHDFIVSLPDGYQTLVGERGMRLCDGTPDVRAYHIHDRPSSKHARKV